MQKILGVIPGMSEECGKLFIRTNFPVHSAAVYTLSCVCEIHANAKVHIISDVLHGVIGGFGLSTSDPLARLTPSGLIGPSRVYILSATQFDIVMVQIGKVRLIYAIPATNQKQVLNLPLNKVCWIVPPSFSGRE